MTTQTALVFPQNTQDMTTARPMFAYIADDESQTLRMFTRDMPPEAATSDAVLIPTDGQDYSDLPSVIYFGIWNHTKPNTTAEHATLDEAIAYAIDALAGSQQ